MTKNYIRNVVNKGDMSYSIPEGFLVLLKVLSHCEKKIK